MPEAIGVDLGGTKMLVGVVDAERNGSSTARPRPASACARTSCSRRSSASSGRRSRRAPRPAPPDSASRARSTAARRGDHRGQPRARGRADPRPDAASGSASRCRSTTTPTWRCSPSTGSARPGARANAAMLTIGTGIGGGLIIDGRAVPRIDRGGRGAGPRRDRGRRPSLPGQLPEPRLRGGRWPPAPRSLARGGRRPSGRPTPRSAGRLPAAEELDGKAGDRRRPRRATRRRSRGDGAGRDGASGVALASLANAFDPDVIVDRRRRDRGRRAAGGPGSRRARRAGAAADERDPVAAAELGPDAGMIGAAAMAMLELEGGELDGGPADRLPDADRQPRGPEPARPRALGEADLVACEDTRRAGRLFERLDIPRPRLVSYHEGNEAERAVQLAQQIERGAKVTLISDAGTPVDLRPRLPADPRLHRARPGWSRCCPGPRR